MWIFLPGGLLMPSITPLELAPQELTLGYRDIQVRGRLRSHLETFLQDFMSDLDHSEIEMTPEKDYNCRFYTTREALATALARTVNDIDYEKFKPTAERKDDQGKPRYKDGAVYHGVLNAIWSSVTRLAPAGGSWGPRSKDNPNGYDSARKYSGWSGSKKKNKSEEAADKAWWDTHGGGADLFSEVDDILYKVRDVPVDEWPDLLTLRELDLIQPEYNDAIIAASKQVLRKDARQNKKSNRARYTKSGRR